MTEEFKVKCLDDFIKKSVEFVGNWLKKKGLEKMSCIFEGGSLKNIHFIWLELGTRSRACAIPMSLAVAFFVI